MKKNDMINIDNVSVSVSVSVCVLLVEPAAAFLQKKNVTLQPNQINVW